MEKIGDFFKELKTRLSNPFISSFIISWLLFNWRIPVGLAFYNARELSVDGYKSFINLITTQINVENSFRLPLLASLLYTFVFPFFRNFITAFDAWIKAWGSSLNYKLSKSGSVSIEKYIELRNTYAQRTKLLEETLKKDSKFLQENEGLKNKILEIENEKNVIQSQSQRWQDLNSAYILNGEWNFNVTDKDSNLLMSKLLLIKDGTVSEIFNSSRDKKVIGRIESFHYNLNSQEISFYINTNFLKDIDFASHFYTFNVTSGNNPFSFLQGEEDKKNPVRLSRVD